MEILLIILLAALISDCSSCGPDDPPPVPPPCLTVSCVRACGDTPTTVACGPCPGDMFDESICPPGSLDGGRPDAAFPGDASVPECELAPCFMPARCAVSCEAEPYYVGCCECAPTAVDLDRDCVDGGLPDDGGGPPDASVPDGGPRPDGGGLLAIGEACFDDRQCASGLCYGDVDVATGAFLPPTCQAACLPVDDAARYCRSDIHCCAGTCCLGCGELEGRCRD